MKKWIEQIKAKFKNQEFDYKQMFLGIVIFIFAIVFLTVAFHSEEETLMYWPGHPCPAIPEPLMYVSHKGLYVVLQIY